MVWTSIRGFSMATAHALAAAAIVVGCADPNVKDQAGEAASQLAEKAADKLADKATGALLKKVGGGKGLGKLAGQLAQGLGGKKGGKFLGKLGKEALSMAKDELTDRARAVLAGGNDEGSSEGKDKDESQPGGRRTAPATADAAGPASVAWTAAHDAVTIRGTAEMTFTSGQRVAARWSSSWYISTVDDVRPGGQYSITFGGGHAGVVKATEILPMPDEPLADRGDIVLAASGGSRLQPGTVMGKAKPGVLLVAWKDAERSPSLVPITRVVRVAGAPAAAKSAATADADMQKDPWKTPESPTAQPLPAATGDGRIVIISKPANAVVVINGNDFGNAPTEELKFPVGTELAIEVTMKGYRSYTRTIKVVTNNTIRVNAILERGK
jgi:hypothetical protein